MAKIWTGFCIFWQNYGKNQVCDRSFASPKTQTTQIFGKNWQKIFARQKTRQKKSLHKH
ncbi:hypothetical protein H6G74_21540 [Nostoc spongiaeforme FACHB-130]|uniref:Uncharacterized protein n=1 Tax=Nostoc spongiaeforme FACHB-130 TaxID=1357510 RepID=A0ABR8G0Z4_9NOSO|nr:hypothetical protein [Nostoc spongiaeforme]MBD2596896.1 hypothetical protein [Nostoc spongiaeforme FACHB-130]